ncbi:hypothetical protein [Rhodococcus tukisamuensis]|uniref:Uncharacterized protein n=1 Tax=Rhodococcus tukisamuensis TaxID=168276 RepID=A0A1G6UH65_9NOCA|nr:hypothetical protein [Rhodococcus tukisamuensis]SDD40056.1 hypothetical protein SAMN05444580_104173 [Rhodococcus tukisamuensis]
MSDIRMTSWDRRCVTATTAELRTRGLVAILAADENCREVIVTEPGRAWMASVLPGGSPDEGADVLLFSADPAEQWTDEYLQWADSVESMLAPRPLAA